MSAEDDLRINTLHRFAKASPRLTLREYSHCEVPAGCGGVVLRWVDPSEGALVHIVLSSPNATIDAWLDGKPIATRSNTVARRVPHVLAFHARHDGEAAPGPLLVAPSVALDPDGPSRRGAATSVLRRSVSARVSPVAVAGFERPDLDDRGWGRAGLATTDLFEPLQTWERAPLAEALARDEPVYQLAGEAWLRLHFEIPEEA